MNISEFKSFLRKEIRKSILEAETTPDSTTKKEYTDQDLTNLFKQDYEGFVSQLGTFAKDPKFKDFIQSGDTVESSVSKTSIKVADLRPTQNEIDIDKSLMFPLTNATSLGNCLSGGSVEIAKPIITFNGQYIIDGHHRWSQLYACNKDASIVSFDFKNPKIKTPKGALKATQLAISTLVNAIPSQQVQGKNLLKMKGNDIIKYVMDTIKDDTILMLFDKSGKIKGKFGKGGSDKDKDIFKRAIGDYIWSNVKSMQTTSQPVSGAPGRGIMPQADDVPGGQAKTIDKLKTGLKLPADLKETIQKSIKKMIVAEIKTILKESNSIKKKK